jgi:beta-lactamase regulating signal transducer with metallopeptidase domain
MPPIPPTISNLLPISTDTVQEIIVKSLLLPLLALLIAALLRGARAVYRHRVYLVAFVVVALLPLVTMFASMVPSPSVRLPHSFSIAQMKVVYPPLEIPVAVPQNGAMTRDAPPESGVKPPIVVSPYTLLRTLWLFGTLVSLTGMVLGLQKARVLAQSGTPAPDAVTQLADETAKIAGIVPVPVRIVPGAAVPMVFGIRKPCVLLPPIAVEWSRDCLRSVLLHEMVHIARADFAVQIFCRWITVLYVWNPFVWLLYSRMRVEAETACDEQVLRLGVSPRDYASHLFTVAHYLTGNTAKSVPPSLLAMARSGKLEGRIQMILHTQSSRSYATVRLVFALGLAALLPLLMFRVNAAAQPPLSESVSQDASAFLRWSMNQHNVLQTYRASSRIQQSILRRNGDTETTWRRTIAYVRPNRFHIEWRPDSPQSTFSPITLTSDGSYLTTRTRNVTEKRVAPRTLSDEGFHLQLIERTPLYNFFGGAPEWRKILDKGTVRFDGETTQAGQQCKILRFTVSERLGETKAIIRIADGMILRFESERLEDYSRGKDREGLNVALTFARERLTHSNLPREQKYYTDKIAQLEQMLADPPEPARIRIVEEFTDIALNTPLSKAQLSGEP